MYGSWEGKKYVILVPLKLIFDRIYALGPEDTFIVGKLNLPRGSEIMGTEKDLLISRLREEGYLVEKADFPQHGKWSAEFVARYLRGEFGSAKEVKAKRASLFYALDRYFS